MATATADRLDDTTAGDDYGQALGEGEITRLLKTVQAAQFKKSETFVAEDTAFKPRSLVEIAFAAEQKRQQEEQAARAAEQAAAAAAEATDTAGPADPLLSEAQAPAPQTQQSVPEHGPEGVPETLQDVAQASAQQAEEEARRQREQEDEALRQAAEEQGYKRGFEAGLEAARTAEPTAEELALQAEKEQEKQTIVAKFQEAIAALASPQVLDSTALSQAINDAVRQLAAERAGQVIAENPEGFLRRIRQLVDRVSTASQQIEVFVNPADLEVLNRWMQDHTAPSGWQFTADTHLGHGDIRLLLGGIEISDILNPVAATAEEDQPVPADDAEQVDIRPADVSVSEAEAEQIGPEPAAEAESEPVAEPAPEPAPEESPEQTSDENSEQSPERGSE